MLNNKRYSNHLIDFVCGLKFHLFYVLNIEYCRGIRIHENIESIHDI